MAYFSHSDVGDLLKGVQALYSEQRVEEMPVRMLHVVKSLVDVEVVTYDTVDAVRGVTLLQVPVTPEVTEVLPALFEHLESHPIIPAFYKRAAEPAKTSDFATLNQFRDTAVYSTVYRGLGLNYQLGVFPQGEEFKNVSVTLSRRHRDFTERDRQILGLLSPHYTQAFRNARVLDESRREKALMLQGSLAARQEFIFLSESGVPRKTSSRAREWLQKYFPEKARRSGLPDEVRNWLRGWRARTGQHSNWYPAEKPLIVSQPESRLIVRWYQDAENHEVLLLTEEQSLFAAARMIKLGLTAREGEVARWVAEGKTDSEIGIILGVSSHTAHKHVQNILKKLEAPNRAAALLRITELLNF
jgi:DNA-binding CsgD family transcriptional regulator